MEIRQLEAFNAIVVSGSVTSAGHMLGRSQPVISRQVGDLEEEIGLVLFERTRPTITLTQAGIEFYQEVRGILADLQQLNSRVDDMRSGKISPMRILASSDLAHGILPLALAHYDNQDQVFQHKLIIEEVVHEALISDLLDGGAEFALINLPIEEESVVVHWSVQAPCQLAVPSSHPFAGKSTIGLDQLGADNIITLLGRYRMRFNLTTSLVRATINKNRRHIEVASQTTALSLVRSGMGVALMDPFSIHGADLSGISLVPLHTEVNYIIGAVSQSIHVLSDDAKVFIDNLHQYVVDVINGCQETNTNGLQSVAANRFGDK